MRRGYEQGVPTVYGMRIASHVMHSIRYRRRMREHAQRVQRELAEARTIRPPMCRIAGVSEDVLRRAALANCYGVTTARTITDGDVTADPDEAFRQHQRDRIAEAQRYDAEQAKPKLTPGVVVVHGQSSSHHSPIDSPNKSGVK